MFVTAYDDRVIMPDYFTPFIWNTTRFCDLHLIAPIKKLKRSTKPNSKFMVQLIDPSALPKYRHTKRLFDDLFINYSTNNDSFERACFHRWFAINAATTTLNSNDFICLLDTDFLIGMNPSDVLSLCQSKAENFDIQFIAEWAGDEPVAIGPEITIMTKSYLYGFCRYLLTTYYSPPMRSQLLVEYFDRIGNGLSGGICDMRALAAYSKLHHGKIFNLQNIEYPQIIGNLNSFLKNEIGKTDNWNICFQSDIQTLNIANESKKLIGTHFQGSSKSLMCLAYRANGNITRDICVEHLASQKTYLRKKVNRLKYDIVRLIKCFAKKKLD